MKIALIASPLIPVPPRQYGGIERIVFMLIQELKKKGHEVTLFASPDSEPNCRLVGYRESRQYNRLEMLRINGLTAKIILQDFDLVHTFGRMSNIALLMCLRLPKLVSYQLPPTLSQVKKAVKIAPGGTLSFTACSNYIKSRIEQYADVHTIYNGVDTSHYVPEFAVDERAPLVFLGRIQEEKGTAIAIDIARRAGRQLIIAGNIPEEPIHRAYFHTAVKPWLDDRQITYIGPVNDLQKNELLRSAAALLMPVLWDEPFGIVMVEALACGTPVIGFRRGAVPEVIENGHNGYLCDNADQMIDAVQLLGNIDRQACRATAENKFSAGVLSEQYENLYRQIIRRH